MKFSVIKRGRRMLEYQNRAYHFENKINTKVGIVVSAEGP